MTTTIVNGAPMTISLGVNDKSTRTLVSEAEAIPSHLPFVPLFTKDGPSEAQLVVGNSRIQMYGEDSFDIRKKWANHATVLSNTVNATGNSQMIKRMIPKDAKPKANFRIVADVLATKIPDYERNDDGSIKTDGTGAPIATGTSIDGYSVKWLVEHIGVDVDGVSLFAAGTQSAGDQIDATTSTQSVRYPVMDLEYSHVGDIGNNFGVRLWAPTVASTSPIAERFLTKEKVYPFRIACIKRADSISTPSFVETLDGEQFVNYSFQEGSIDRSMDVELYIGSEFIRNYRDLYPVDGSPAKYGPFGRIHVYDEVVSELLTKFYTAEVPYIDMFSDFTGETDEQYRFNMLGGVSSQNVPYHSYKLVTTGENVVRFTENSNIYATGGSDGTMNDEVFAKLVAEEMDNWANESGEMMDTAGYPVSIMYDSGYPLETKYALCKFIAARKDTAVVLATAVAGEAALTASEDSARALALKTRLQMYPESEFFGTSTLRGCIVGRSGILLQSQYKKRLPLTIEFANKAATYMGAGSGNWDSTKSFDERPNNEIDMFGELNVTFTPSTVRNKDWSNGMIWVERVDRRKFYFPAAKTVYDDDTSVLNSFMTMMACVELEKVGDRARRQYSGNSKLTNAQLAERVVDYVNESVKGRFDSRFIIVPEVYFTKADTARGYSWTLKIKIGAPNLKTVSTLIIEAYRIEDMETAA